jgi:ADP-ribosylglycohydrolase
LGQIAGDSLGSLVEFQAPDEIRQKYPERVMDLSDGGTFNTIAGQPTDDSEMALILARTLVLEKKFKVESVQRAYRHWFNSGPFDCGNTTASGLRGFPNKDSEANGALMRISPLGIFASNAPEAAALKWARQDAAITHPNPICQDASALFALAIGKAVRTGAKSDVIYDSVLNWAIAMQCDARLVQAIRDAADSPPKDYMHHQGWVLVAFQNALYRLLHEESLESAAIDTVMQGGDTDTNAAICGALLGAVHGREAVPARWVKKILSCRPLPGLPAVERPRPEPFWPVDALLMAERLLNNDRA